MVFPVADEPFSKRRLLIMAGGTGGHIFPALAVAEALREQAIDIAWLGSVNGMEARLLADKPIPLHLIQVSGLRGKGWRHWLMAPWRLLQAVRQAYRIIKKFNPDVVLGLGGFASGPGGLVCWLLKKPLVIHEQNAVAGTTNRILAHWATRVLQAFPNTFLERWHPTTTGNPIRADLASIPAPEIRFANKSTDKFNILIVGGSQGALILNEVVPLALGLLPMTFNVWHQSGKTGFEACQAAYQAQKIAARVDVFIEDMRAAWQWADLIICRAGALTVAEIATVGVASILIPLPHAIDDHQTANANYLANAGAAVLLPQNQLTPDQLMTIVKAIFSTPGRLQEMASKARGLSMEHALAQVVDICLSVVQ